MKEESMQAAVEFYQEIMIFHRVVIPFVIYDIPSVTGIFYGHTRYPVQIAKVRKQTGKM